MTTLPDMFSDTAMAAARIQDASSAYNIFRELGEIRSYYRLGGDGVRAREALADLRVDIDTTLCIEEIL
jgi:hypothetical protein